RCELRQCRLVALAVRLQAGGERDRAVRLDRDGDGVEVARAGEPLVDCDLRRPAALLHERAEADADVSAFVAEVALPVAERFVADELAGAADRFRVAAAVVAAAGRRDGRLAVR